MLVFPTYEGHRTLAIEQGAEIRDFHTLHIEQPTKILQNRIFIEENTTSSLRKSFSPLFLQEFRPLTPLKETDRFTSLKFIGSYAQTPSPTLHLPPLTFPMPIPLISFTFLQTLAYFYIFDTFLS
jgi:hypothetical protein